jgi:hypothetical protein
MPMSINLNDSRDIAMAFSAQSDQQQITGFDCAREIGDRDSMATFAAPDIGKQQPLAITGHGCPQFSCWASKFREGFDWHINRSLRVRVVPCPL